MDLSEDQLRLVRWLADTSRQFSGDGTPHGWPDMIPAEVALRLAEKSYRRGVTQGSGYAIDEMRRGGIAAADAYDHALWEWRAKGVREEWASGELPPGYVERARR
jgi:hypothetical protein